MDFELDLPEASEGEICFDFFWCTPHLFELEKAFGRIGHLPSVYDGILLDLGCVILKHSTLCFAQRNPDRFGTGYILAQGLLVLHNLVAAIGHFTFVVFFDRAAADATVAWSWPIAAVLLLGWLHRNLEKGETFFGSSCCRCAFPFQSFC